MPCTATADFSLRTNEMTLMMTLMMDHAFLFAGLLVGFSIAVPIGPMGLLCIQRTLASGLRAGVSTGLRAATANVLCGALIILGLDKVASLAASGGRVLNVAGGVFLLCSAARMALRQRSPRDQLQPAALSPLAAYVSAVVFNATNPLSPILIVACWRRSSGNPRHRSAGQRRSCSACLQLRPPGGSASAAALP
jgi:hypothetical protein